MPEVAPPHPTEGEQQPETETLRVANEFLAKGFTLIPNYILRHPDLSRDAKLLYAILLSYAWREGRCFPGYTRLCADLGASEKPVRGYMRELEKAGLLTQKRRGLGKTNIYTLTEPRSGVSPGLDREFRAALDREDAPGKEDSEEEDRRGRTSKLRKPPTTDRSSGTAPVTGVNGAIAPAAPAQKPLRARLPPEERRRYDADRRRIVDYLSDFARELGDAAPLASSVTRAVNLMHRAGVDLEEFVGAMYHARAVTKERWAAVRKEERAPGRPFPRKRAMAYFFAELEHALGLRELPETPAEHAARKEAETRERRREGDRHPDWARAKGPREWVQTYKPGEGLPAIGADGGEDEGA